MPVFDYKCSGCKKEFPDEFQHTATLKTKCPSCGEEKLERLWTGEVVYRDKDYYTKGDQNALIYKDLNHKYKRMAKSINKKNGYLD